MIQSENTFLVGYVIFDKKQGKAEVDVVKEATKVIEGKIQNGELKLTKGVSYKFAGNYEQQERATARLMIVVPLALLIVLLVLYFQFKTLTASLIHFSGVFVAFAGGFILLWLYGQDWFMNFSLAGVNMRDLFQMHTINLSVAVWVGFIALFGVATDDGVLMGTYIHHVFLEKDPQTRHAIREAVVTAGLKRVRPAAMTTATTLIALLPENPFARWQPPIQPVLDAPFLLIHATFGYACCFVELAGSHLPALPVFSFAIIVLLFSKIARGFSIFFY